MPFRTKHSKDASLPLSLDRMVAWILNGSEA